MHYPQPRQLDGELTSPPVAGFADTLLPASLAAVIRRAGEAKITADLTAVIEGAIEHLVDQFLAADRADAFEVDELHDLGFRRTRLCGTQFGTAFGFDLGDLPGDQLRPLVLARDLLLQLLGERTTLAGAQLGKPSDERSCERLDVADGLSVQESLDAVDVSRALLDQTLAFAGAALAILILNRGNMDDAAQ